MFKCSQRESGRTESLPSFEEPQTMLQQICTHLDLPKHSNPPNGVAANFSRLYTVLAAPLSRVFFIMLHTTNLLHSQDQVWEFQDGHEYHYQADFWVISVSRFTGSNRRITHDSIQK